MQTSLLTANPEIAPNWPTLSTVERRVLVVEDDPDMRALVVATLRVDGYQIFEAGCGIDFLEWMETTNWATRHRVLDAIVSDIKLPDLTAIEVLAALRCQSSRVPVVLLTAFGDPQIHAEAYALGAVAVLTKPLDLDALRTVLRRVVGDPARRFDA